MDNLQKELQSFFNLNEDMMVDLLKDLISQDTTNPPGNEYRAAKVVQKFLKKGNIKSEIYEPTKGRSNIIARVGKDLKKQLVLNSHMDVVPAGVGWKTDPFKAVVKGGRVYGRGAIDDKGPLTMLLMLARFFRRYEKDIDGQLVVIGSADEEGGSIHGMPKLLKKMKPKPKWGIVVDTSGDKDNVVIAEKGLIHIGITSNGEQTHASTPHKGVNAIENMMDLLNLIRNHKWKYKPHKLLKNPTLNIGMIEGGSAANIVPGKCTAVIDIRYLPSQTKKDVLEQIQKLAKKIKKGKFTVKEIENINPTEVDPKSRIVKTLQKNMKIVSKKNIKLKGIGGATDSKQMVFNGIEAVDMGIGDTDAHMANENIKIKDMKDAGIALGLTVAEMLGLM